ncbi:MAG TPA: shikimate dehydrogenase [Steroidobacteraceae bacterium]|jgi:shikimate dehydrogenase|nr:shikimate dehydrogenase [Steroidobacteraceae bacterium]
MPAPERYAVIGHPIAHSLSPQIHTLFARQTRQNLSYVALDVPPERLAAQVQGFFAAGGRGLNVTVPHKQAVMALLDGLTERARRALAVNTIARHATAGLLGDNTDGVGLVRDLVHNLHLAVRSQRILLLGAGGAARGVLGPLLELGPRELVIANRSFERAAALAHEWAAAGPVRAAELGTEAADGGVAGAAALAGFDLILNATAASLQGEVPALPPQVVRSAAVCYDLAYGRRDTAFVRWARSLGAAQVHMGLGMLVEQAAESFQRWRGVRPDTAPVLAALRGGQP